MKENEQTDCHFSFSSLLLKEFSKRKNKNPKYSLRAFANLLDVDQSLLTKVINGKKMFSTSTVQKCLQKLNVGEEDSSIISQLENRKDNPILAHINNSLLQEIDSWIYIAILELFKLKDFEFDVEKFSSKLGIELDETNHAVAILIKHGFIIFKGGKWSLSKPHTSWLLQKGPQEEKKFFSDLNKLFTASLTSVAPENRFQSTMTLSIDQLQMPYFKNKIAELQEEFSSCIQKRGEKNSVYQLSVLLYPVTRD